MADSARDTLDESLRTVYRELCNSYRAIDDFRTKLLGFLPLATGTAAFFLVTDREKLAVASSYLGPIGVFGFVITLGLFCYEFYAIKKCGALIEAGKLLEKELHIGHGQFLSRPRRLLGLINEPFAAGVIYPAVLGAWTFVALNFLDFSQHLSFLHFFSHHPLRGAAGVFVAGFAISVSYTLKDKLKRLRKR